MHLLIVDDEKNIRRTFTLALEAMGHDASAASTGAAALQELRRESFDAVLLDLSLSQESGLDVLNEMLKISPRAAVILVTAFASIETAVEAMRRGAFDYLPKPCTPEQLRQVLARVEKTRRLENKVAEFESRAASEYGDPDLSSSAPAMLKVLDVAFKAAETDATILILGESGTGKGVLARAIHRRSPRKEQAFITVNCPSLSRELLEGELFGHVKGAFTGAVTDRWGKVAAADRGTLFLDEIGELPFEIQSKLLRLLQEREYERLGEANSRRANVRVIAATNRNLVDSIAGGTFREDLYYRLNVISLRVPSLRERMSDLEPIVNGLVQTIAARVGKKVKGVTPEALGALAAYHWPGNLRELRNVLERAVILTRNATIEASDLAETIQPSTDIRIGSNVSLEKVENEHIRMVVANARNLEEAAAVLGIDPATLYRRRKKIG